MKGEKLKGIGESRTRKYELHKKAQGCNRHENNNNNRGAEEEQ